MVASSTHLPAPSRTVSDALVPLLSKAGPERPAKRRRISPEAGRALEILGHAIEYLADEYVHRGTSFSANDPQIKAVQLLMELNREIYFECPVIPTFSQRIRTFLHLSRT
jgi:hypothetical protein